MKSLGIDFGTSTTEIVARDGRDAYLLHDAKGNEVLTSAVAYPPIGGMSFGKPAQRRYLVDPTNALFAFKRIIGLPWLAEQVSLFRRSFHFNMLEGPNHTAVFRTRAGDLSAAQVTTQLLTYVRGFAGIETEHLDCVMASVPATFRPEQKNAIAACAAAAGFDNVRLTHEAYAAALPYLREGATARTVLVYDLGGGTFDTAVLRTRGLAHEELAWSGDAYLGGSDIDRELALVITERVLKEYRMDLSADIVGFQKLIMAAELAKIRLSYVDSATVELGVAHPSLMGKKLTVDRTQLDGCIQNLVRRTFVLLDETLSKAALKAKDIDAIVLAGGSTLLPIIQRSLWSYFGREPLYDIPPDKVVAIGASLAAALSLPQ